MGDTQSGLEITTADQALAVMVVDRFVDRRFS
jgi:hypothetical protein